MKMTKSECPCCGEHHPVDEGITVFTLEYECRNHGPWIDTWCAAVDCECPVCGSDYSPEITDEEVIEEAQYGV